MIDCGPTKEKRGIAAALLRIISGLDSEEGAEPGLDERHASQLLARDGGTSGRGRALTSDRTDQTGPVPAVGGCKLLVSLTMVFQNLDFRLCGVAMLTTEQRDEFERLGIMQLPGAIARADAGAMCDRVWQALGKRYGLRRESPATWNKQYLLGTHHLPKSETFPEIGSPAIRSALDDLFGSGNWEPPERWGSLLVTFPNSHDQWTVPHQAWHLDYPASSEMKELSIVRIFVCLAKLEPCSGGTVFVAGSHRAIQNLVSKEGAALMRSADARTALICTYAWMRSLCTLDESLDRVEAFMRESSVADGVELRVVEMTGEPGDAFLTHPLLLHTGSKNTATYPRIALSSTVYRAGFKIAALFE